jgi:SAM-dependent methyltransferase
MTAMPWTIYGAALDRGLSLVARHDDGLIQNLAVQEWLDDAGPVDERLISRARGPVLDVGCGPGRHVHALVRRGVAVLGIDASPSAVRIASARGAEAVQGDIFDHGLELGVWETVLLLDGNVGIGGDPVLLLRTVGEFLTRTGRVLVETDAPGGTVRAAKVRLERGDDVSHWFPWARVPSDELDGVAAQAAMRVAHRWEDTGRWFAELEWA